MWEDYSEYNFYRKILHTDLTLIMWVESLKKVFYNTHA